MKKNKINSKASKITNLPKNNKNQGIGVNESSLTGESTTTEKETKILAGEKAIADQKNMPSQAREQKYCNYLKVKEKKLNYLNVKH